MELFRGFKLNTALDHLLTEMRTKSNNVYRFFLMQGTEVQITVLVPSDSVQMQSSKQSLNIFICQE